MQKPPEIGSRVAVVLPGTGMVTATVSAVRSDEARTFVVVLVERRGREETFELPLGVVQPLN